MPSDLYSIVSACKRIINVVEAIGEQCQWIKEQLAFPVSGGVADFNRMLNLVADACEVTEMCDQLRASLDDYLIPYENDYKKLGLKDSQIQTIETFISMTNIRPLGTFQALYQDLGRPSRIVPPVLTQQVGEHVSNI